MGTVRDLYFSQGLTVYLIQDRMCVRRKSGPQPPTESSVQRFWHKPTKCSSVLRGTEEHTLSVCLSHASFLRIPLVEREGLTPGIVSGHSRMRHLTVCG